MHKHILIITAVILGYACELRIVVRAYHIRSMMMQVCYTRGTPISLHVRMEGPDEQALGLLSSPSALRVQLIRRIVYHTRFNVINWKKGKNQDLVPADTQTLLTPISTAIFWPSIEGSADMHARHLFGEVLVPFNAVPSHDGVFFKVNVRSYVHHLVFGSA